MKSSNDMRHTRMVWNSYSYSMLHLLSNLDALRKSLPFTSGRRPTSSHGLLRGNEIGRGKFATFTLSGVVHGLTLKILHKHCFQFLLIIWVCPSLLSDWEQWDTAVFTVYCWHWAMILGRQVIILAFLVQTFGGVEAKLLYFASVSRNFFLRLSSSSSSLFFVVRWSLFALCSSCSRLCILFLRLMFSSCKVESCLSVSFVLIYSQKEACYYTKPFS